METSHDEGDPRVMIDQLRQQLEIVAQALSSIEAKLPERQQDPPAAPLERARRRWGMPVAAVMAGAFLARQLIEEHRRQAATAAGAVAVSAVSWLVAQQVPDRAAAPPPAVIGAPPGTQAPSRASPADTGTRAPSETTSAATEIPPPTRPPSRIPPPQPDTAEEADEPEPASPSSASTPPEPETSPPTGGPISTQACLLRIGVEDLARLHVACPDRGT